MDFNKETGKYVKNILNKKGNLTEEELDEWAECDGY